jgi:hypothetical protein
VSENNIWFKQNVESERTVLPDSRKHTIGSEDILCWVSYTFYAGGRKFHSSMYTPISYPYRSVKNILILYLRRYDYYRVRIANGVDGLCWHWNKQNHSSDAGLPKARLDYVRTFFTMSLYNRNFTSFLFFLFENAEMKVTFFTTSHIHVHTCIRT